MNLKQSSAFSISKGLKKTIHQMNDLNKNTPGPIYNITKFQQPEQTISHTIGKSQRSQINQGVNQTPSPDKYNLKEYKKDPIMKSIPKAINKIQKNQNPDPCCYDPKISLNKPSAVAYGLGSRYPSILQPNNYYPGPGDYQNNQPLPILSKSKSQKPATFGKSSRFKYQVSQTPGVGNYQIVSEKRSQQKFKSISSIGKAKKLFLNDNTGPGPSDYPKISFVQENMKHKKGKTIHKRFEEGILSKISLTSNAYNKYFENPQDIFKDKQKNPTFTFNKSPRKYIDSNNNPSPVEYINHLYKHKNTSHALINLSKHIQYQPNKNKPGPGTYQINHKPQIQYSFPRSKSLVLKNNNPGAGRYNPKLIQKVKVHAFSKSPKLNYGNTSSVAVGQYDINPSSLGEFHISKSDNQSIKFSQSDRFKQTFDRSPGPGYYQTYGLVGNKSILKSK